MFRVAPDTSYGAHSRARKKRRKAKSGPPRLYDPLDDALKTFGRRWLPVLLIAWGMLQAADVSMTYWGLSLPTIIEANPVMAGVIEMPIRVILIKSALTISVAVLLLRIEYFTPYSSIPIFTLITGLMAYVFFNNWGLIAQAGGHIVNGSINAP